MWFFFGKHDEYPAEHIVMVHEISYLYGHDEVKKHYYFLKLFPSPWEEMLNLGTTLCSKNP
jgi:hypothetical protein